MQVKDPTPDMDPMDIRYAWILWINRDERGFSSGGTYRDPRTGEILGSKTRMDSHRIRTIGNYFESYTPTTGTRATMPDSTCGMVLPVPEEVLALASQAGANMPEAQRELALRRQSLLTAHELGHVMGFGHNFASSINDRASAMEYPTPRVKVTAGRLDLSEAFNAPPASTTRSWRATPTPSSRRTRRRPGSNAIIAEMRAKNILYVPVHRPALGRGTTIARRRPRTCARRWRRAKIMLDAVRPRHPQAGEPIGALRDMRLWMTYLHHRWAIEAGLGYIGGMYHNIVVKGETLPPTEIVPAALQRDVLRPADGGDRAGATWRFRNRCSCSSRRRPGRNLEDLSRTTPSITCAPARILSAMVIEPLLEPDKRGAAGGVRRSADRTRSRCPKWWTRCWRIHGAPRDADPRHASLRRVTERVALDAMMILGAHDDTSPEARAYVLDQIARLGESLGQRKDERSAHRRALPPSRARHRTLSREPEGAGAEERHAVLGRPPALALPAAAGTAVGVQGKLKREKRKGKR